MLERKSKASLLIPIQALRGIAALIVVVGHSITEIHQENVTYPNLPFNFGIGVDIFFLVSGFVMMLTASKGASPTSIDFLHRRIVRVVPLYWFYTSAMLLAVWIVPDQLNNGSVSGPQIACSYFFIPCINNSGQYSPVLALGWTLNYEMFFYVIFAVALIGRDRTAWLYKLWILLLAALVLGSVFPGVWAFWGNPIVLEFLAGSFIALLYTKIGAQPSKIAFLLSIATAMAIYALVTRELEFRVLALGIPAILLTTGFTITFPTAWERYISVPSRYIGDSSYSLYLSHPFTLGVCKVLWLEIDPSKAYPTIFLFSTVLASVLIARASYLLFEVPVTRALTKTSDAGSRQRMDLVSEGEK